MPVQPASTSASQDAPRQTQRKLGGAISLQEAVHATITRNPKMGIVSARAEQASANITIARSGVAPKVDAEVGLGGSATSNVNGHWTDYRSRKSTLAHVAETKLTLRKLIFDFNATQKNIDRAEKLYAAELFKRYDTAEELAAKTIDAYLRARQQQDILLLIREDLAALQEIARLVSANEAGGNATQADVSRVETTLAEARKNETDQEAQLETALDQFRRLTQLDPNNLARPSKGTAFVPRNEQEAENLITRQNPELLALSLISDALLLETESVKAGNKPKLELEIEGTNQTHFGVSKKQDTSVSAMVYMRKNLYDGGAHSGQVAQLQAKYDENQMRYYDARDELIYDLRRQYRAVRAAKDKQKDLAEAVRSASEVKRLYREQFKAGKRTLFELLDSQTAYTNARRDEISNANEAMRAEYGILRATGQLLKAIFPE